LGLRWQTPNPSNWGEYSEDQDGFMKRQRGRGRKPGGGGGGGGGNHNHGNRSLESNGPEVKIRGTAAQIYEKYAQYARDAQSGGDRVKYENFLQHAEHYFRVMVATMPRDRVYQPNEGGGPPQQGGEDRGPGQETGGESADPMKVVDENAGGADDDGDFEGDDGDDVREGEEVEASGQGASQDGNQGDRQGRRRRRGRNRNRDQDGGPNNTSGNNNSNGNGGGDTEARSALDSLARKQGALAGG
jgi:hypothetical protein